LGRFATGVTVLTAGAPGGPVAGLTANAFSSVSLDPPLVLVCVKAASRSLGVIRARGCFAVHVLAAADLALAQAFARSGLDKFAGLELTFSASGLPRLPDYLARFECALEREHPGGDHRILIGRVLQTELPERPAEPLIFYRSRLGACTCAAGEARICYT
jgi:flavin reductase (DIM6/NTAB) family NADH-FMN oxidoreductase RutF